MHNINEHVQFSWEGEEAPGAIVVDWQEVLCALDYKLGYDHGLHAGREFVRRGRGLLLCKGRLVLVCAITNNFYMYHLLLASISPILIVHILHTYFAARCMFCSYSVKK